MPRAPGKHKLLCLGDSGHANILIVLRESCRKETEEANIILLNLLDKLMQQMGMSGQLS